ncbi:hypothetical protein V6N13_038369 [Hibiscus sabdariffa]
MMEPAARSLHQVLEQATQLITAPEAERQEKVPQPVLVIPCRVQAGTCPLELVSDARDLRIELEMEMEMASFGCRFGKHALKEYLDMPE